MSKSSDRVQLFLLKSKLIRDGKKKLTNETTSDNQQPDMNQDEVDYSMLFQLEKTKKKKKKKKKKPKKEDKEKQRETYDYSDINYDGDFKEIMKEFAVAFESFIEYIDIYTIYDGITEKKWKKNIKLAKKLIRKLKKGDPSVFNIDELNDYISKNHKLLM